MGTLVAPDCPGLAPVVPSTGSVRVVDKMLEGPESGIIPLGIVYGAFSAGCPKNLRASSCPRSALMTAGGTVKRTSAALLAASMLLAGCGGDTKPDASTPSTIRSSPTTPVPTTTSASPTTASPATDPNIPAAARAHTPAGAAAFVKYFYGQLNVAWGQPRAGLLAPLSLPDCKTCSTLEDTAADMVAKHQRMRGDTARIDSVDPGATESNGDQSVVVTGGQLATSVVDSNGQKVRDIPADRIRFLATTRWTESGWRVSEIKVLT